MAKKRKWQNVEWPTSLSKTDKHPAIKVLPNGQAEYIGPPDVTQEEAAYVRSDVPIPYDLGIKYYFEVTILSILVMLSIEKLKAQKGKSIY